MTYAELVGVMVGKGCNLAPFAIGRMMDMVEEETGEFPNWSDLVPDWVLESCGELRRSEMHKKFERSGKWWNDIRIDLITKDGKIYALSGWDGESYTDSWQVVDHVKAVGNYDIRPICQQIGEDQFEIVDFEIEEDEQEVSHV